MILARLLWAVSAAVAAVAACYAIAAIIHRMPPHASDARTAVVFAGGAAVYALVGLAIASVAAAFRKYRR